VESKIGNFEDFVNRHELRVIGMSRSGNHAIINWICRQADGRVLFLNCAEPRTNPFASAKPFDHGCPYQASFADFDLSCEQQGQFSHKDWLIFSHEDVFLSYVAKPGFEEQHDAMVGPSAQRTDVLILRDPYNLFASRLKLGVEMITPKTTMRIWKQHAKGFLRRKRFFKNRMVTISFNEWACSEDYRRMLAGELGVEFTDAGFHEVPACGGGSSFESRDFHGEAFRMSVLDRWPPFLDNPDFYQLFDEEIVELSRQIFGANEAAETVLRYAK